MKICFFLQMWEIFPMKIPNFSFLIVLKQNSWHKFSSIFSHNWGPVTFETTSKGKQMIQELLQATTTPM